jgi:hypothetical protein
LVDTFNSRDVDPTRWRVQRHEVNDPLSRRIEERRGDIVVLSAR